MNETCVAQNTTAAESARWLKAASTESVGALSPTQTRHVLASTDIAQRVMRLTGSVRLARRSGQQWHHCGLNE